MTAEYGADAIRGVALLHRLIYHVFGRGNEKAERILLLCLYRRLVDGPEWLAALCAEDLI